VLGDVALFARPEFAQALTGMPRTATLTLAAALALVPVGYLVLAAAFRGRLHIHRWFFEMPGLPLATAQILLGALNFICVAACLHATVSAVAAIPYLEVLYAFVLANTATIITHAPGGLGVIETVVILVLQRPELIGAVLVFRFVYFLVPLCLGGMLLVVSEAWFGSTGIAPQPGPESVSGHAEQGARQAGRDPAGRAAGSQTSGG
jgi:uncharacterized membrane protein YbhN (UPF0104 family)